MKLNQSVLVKIRIHQVFTILLLSLIGFFSHAQSFSNKSENFPTNTNRQIKCLLASRSIDQDFDDKTYKMDKTQVMGNMVFRFNENDPSLIDSIYMQPAKLGGAVLNLEFGDGTETSYTQSAETLRLSEIAQEINMPQLITMTPKEGTRLYNEKQPINIYFEADGHRYIEGAMPSQPNQVVEILWCSEL